MLRREKILRHGFIYIILSNHAHAVKGVHGDIHNGIVTSSQEEGRRESVLLRHSIAIAVDIGDMVRKYYHEVVCA